MESGYVSVLELGSTGIRILVARMDGDGGWEVLDSADRPVALGRDVFGSGELSQESLFECLEVLGNFRELLAGWGMESSAVHGIATSALRVARNRDIFIDRVRQETGFRITVVDGLEENRLMYLGVRFALKQDLPLFWGADSMILEIGGGSTELMLLRQGRMAAAHSLPLGTIPIERRMRARTGPGPFNERYIKDAVRNTVGILSAEMDMAGIRTVVMSGPHAKVAAAKVGKELNALCRLVDRQDFIDFAQKIRNYGIDDCTRKLGMVYAEAEGFVTGIFVLRLLLERTGAERLAVPLLSIREGFLIDMALGRDPDFQQEFHSQITASAVGLGRKHRFEEAHSLHVALLCMKLFDLLEREHGMNRRQRTLLETAAILHDIGTAITASGHHRHGQYIVSNSEIFGLSRDELDIVANVVRYHRGRAPSESDSGYSGLRREDRVLVLKMASLLRIADALDRSHSQKIADFTLERKSSTLVIRAADVHDLSLEIISMAKKADLFRDTFGYRIVLN
ncbi:MAG: HD domain-containing protein [Treponema sp.]|nr:HD domain-containing protein [Treponema sp.]